MASGRGWQLLIGSLVGLFLLLCAWSVRRAALGVSPVSDPRYYEHGLHHDREAAAADPGWTLGVELRGSELWVRPKDRAGAPVAGAATTLILSPGGPGERTVELPEVSPGAYGAALPAGVAGPTPARLQVARGAVRALRSLLLRP